MTTETRRAVRIGNSSGFWGDRGSATLEMVEGGPIDVLTGDYLAELTMLLLWKAQQKNPEEGYARSVLAQLEPVLGTCLQRGIKIVNNAGGLNPAGLSRHLIAVAAELGLHPRIAYVTGDDILPSIDGLVAAGEPLANLDTGLSLTASGRHPVTANAYLGGWGITEALNAGADIVICPRVTDASLVVGPAAWWHGWERTDFDALAGAVVAGHVIECGPQATGGNYSFLREVVDRRYPGFPIAEVAHDGSSIITKHDDTGGIVSVGTVTSQLLYEVAQPAYANPDVVAHFDTVSVAQADTNRVSITGARGTPPPDTAKVAINFLGGFRNTMTLVLTGLDIDEKAEWAQEELFGILGGRAQFADSDVRLIRFDRPDSPTNEQATAHLRITVKDPDAHKVGRRFSNATMELACGGYAGFHTTTPPSAESSYGVYWPTLVPVSALTHSVVTPDGEVRVVEPTSTEGYIGSDYFGDAPTPANGFDLTAEATARAPLGLICGARSGDKGGNANIGVWTPDPAHYAWLQQFLTVEKMRELITEAAGLEVRRFDFANLHALNFVIVGILGEGVASTTRPDAQAKGLAEYLRSRVISIPASFLDQEHS
jgi:hypothetical protein